MKTEFAMGDFLQKMIRVIVEWIEPFFLDWREWRVYIDESSNHFKHISGQWRLEVREIVSVKRSHEQVSYEVNGVNELLVETVIRVLNVGIVMKF